MTEIYSSTEDATREGLFALWLEAKQNGMDGLSDEVWDKLQTLDRQKTKVELETLRKELEIIIGC